MEEKNFEGHFRGEAKPQELNIPPAPQPPSFGLHDSSWSQDQWLQLLQQLVQMGIVDWKDITALVLGHLNPPQVGTALASSEGFKRKYGKGNTMRIVMGWLYSQTGRCADCGSRLELQADHIKGREQYSDRLDADFIENMMLRCRRCNVVRRPSHELGGLTFLTAEAALMWILFVVRPRTYLDFIRMCRLYGMTMSDIRMQEAWAMAHWLSKAEPPAYGIEDNTDSLYDLLLWPDSAITRIDAGTISDAPSVKLYSSVPGTSILGFLTLQPNDKIKFHEIPVSDIPFSSYHLGSWPPQSLCIHYVAPDRENGQPQKTPGLPPRNMRLLAHQIRQPNQEFGLLSSANLIAVPLPLGTASVLGRLLKTKDTPEHCQLVTVD